MENLGNCGNVSVSANIEQSLCFFLSRNGYMYVYILCVGVCVCVSVFFGKANNGIK